MTAPLIISLVSSWSALAPVPELAFALQLAGLGAAIGAAVALLAQRRDADANTWRITTVWATLGLACGLVCAVLSAVA